MGRIEKSKKYISDAMIMLLEKNEYADISINDIVEKSGVSRMTFYRQFYDKKEIVRYIIDQRTENYIKNITYVSPVKEDFIRDFQFLIDGRDLAKKLIKADLFSLIKEEFDKVFSRIQPGYKGAFISGGIANIYYKYVMNDDDKSSEEMAALILDLINLDNYKGQ